MSEAVVTTEKKTQLTPYENFRGEFGKMESAFKAALPPHITAEKFMRIVLTAIQRNPKILEADRKSIFQSSMLAAQDGLLPDGREAAMVVYHTKGGKVCNYLPMVSGLLKKIRNSGELKSLSPHCVYQNETFSYWVDEKGEHLKHEPKFAERGEFMCVYAIAETKEGGIFIEVMSKEDIKKVKSVSRAQGEDSPWNSWFEEMSKKTVIRRLAKRLPMSTDVETLFHRDDELYELNKPRELMPYTPPQYIPGLEPKKTVETLVSDARDLRDTYLITSVLEQLLAQKEYEWIEKIAAKTKEVFPDYVYDPKEAST